MRGPQGVDVVGLHHEQIALKLLIRRACACDGVAVVTVHAVKGDGRAVQTDAQLAVYSHTSDAYTLGDVFASAVEQQGIELRRLSRP